MTAAGVAGLAGCSALQENPYSPGTDDSTEWPMPAYDSGFSAFTPDAAAPRKGVTERWSTELAGLGPTGRPIIAGGQVLVSSSEALVALYLDSGEEHWRHGEDRPWPSAPVVHDGIAYVGFADQEGLVALDMATGEEQWRLETRGSIEASPTFDHRNDHLYVGDDTGRIYQLDLEAGEVVLSGEVFGAVTALAHGSSLLVGTESGEVYEIYPHRGEFTGLWRRKVNGWVTTLVERDGAIFAGTFGGPVYRLQNGADVGTSRWEVERGATHIAATSQAIVGSDGGGLRALDARTGEMKWNQDGRFDSGAAIAGDTVYVGGGEVGEGGHGFVAAYPLAGETGIASTVLGNRRWRFDVESAVMEGVAVADGAVFAVPQSVPESPSRVYALDPT